MSSVFSSSVDPAPAISKWSVRPWMIVFGVLLILGFLLFPLLRGGIPLGIQARQLKEVAGQAVVDLQKGDLVQAQKELTRAQEMLPEVRAHLAQMGLWRHVPLLGVHIRAFEEAVQASEATLTSVSDLLQVAASLQEALQASQGVSGGVDHGVAAHRSFQDLSSEEKRHLLLRLQAVLPQLKIAREKMNIALSEWDRVERKGLVKAVENILQPLVARLHVFQTALDQGIALIETMTPLAGVARPQTYLVLLQNADELRPTGGFIGTVGLVTLDAGEIKRLAFEDVYRLDAAVQGQWHDQPPEILARQLGVPAWFLRDSNWSPDFSVSAARLMDVYTREGAIAHPTSTIMLDGVIALEPKLFERLLGLTGPLQVSGKTFHAGNFFDQLEYDVEMGFLKDGTPVRQRKEIVSQVGAALVASLMNQPSSRWPEMLDVMTTSLHEKDVLLSVRAPEIQRLLDAYGWTGRIKPSPDDYVWVVDANLAALKTDGVMEKEIVYHLDARDPTQRLATVTLTYKNTNRVITWRYTRYRDYVRVYVPEGSELVSSEGAMLNDKTKTGGRVIPGTVDVMHDLGKTVFGAFWAIEPGETRSLSFTYRLPAPSQTAQTDVYTLLVQRQPGAESRLTLDLNFGKNIVSATPPEESRLFGDARYQASFPLRADSVTRVQLVSP